MKTVEMPFVIRYGDLLIIITTQSKGYRWAIGELSTDEVIQAEDQESIELAISDAFGYLGGKR